MKDLLALFLLALLRGFGLGFGICMTYSGNMWGLLLVMIAILFIWLSRPDCLRKEPKNKEINDKCKHEWKDWADSNAKADDTVFVCKKCGALGFVD